MRDQDRFEELEKLWEAYRWATPEPEASAEFMPRLWSRIEAERPAGWVRPFEWLAARLLPVAAALTLALAVLIWDSNGTPTGYVDLLAAELLEEVAPGGEGNI